MMPRPSMTVIYGAVIVMEGVSGSSRCLFHASTTSCPVVADPEVTPALRPKTSTKSAMMSRTLDHQTAQTPLTPWPCFGHPDCPPRSPSFAAILASASRSTREIAVFVLHGAHLPCPPSFLRAVHIPEINPGSGLTELKSSISESLMSMPTALPHIPLLESLDFPYRRTRESNNITRSATLIVLFSTPTLRQYTNASCFSPFICFLYADLLLCHPPISIRHVPTNQHISSTTPLAIPTGPYSTSPHSAGNCQPFTTVKESHIPIAIRRFLLDPPIYPPLRCSDPNLHLKTLLSDSLFFPEHQSPGNIRLALTTSASDNIRLLQTSIPAPHIATPYLS